MSRPGDFPPTRMGLLGARRRQERVRKGTDLLRRKREALVAELFRLARPAIDARAVIAQRARIAYPALLRALADQGRSGLRATAWPLREITLDIRTVQVWGVPVAEVLDHSPIRRSLETRAVSPALAGPAATEAATHFEILSELLVSAAPREMLLRRLGEALARTSRQVHALEQRVAPSLDSQIRRIEGALDQREREEHLRLKHYLRKRR